MGSLHSCRFCASMLVKQHNSLPSYISERGETYGGRAQVLSRAVWEDV